MLTFHATEQINEVSRTTRTRTTTQVITRYFGRWPQTKMLVYYTQPIRENCVKALFASTMEIRLIIFTSRNVCMNELNIQHLPGYFSSKNCCLLILIVMVPWWLLNDATYSITIKWQIFPRKYRAQCQTYVKNTSERINLSFGAC